ncbi:DEAD-box ATP-dependent RNA helicase 38 [Raphanus sativus]|nr:DEAD-box ATP-dependent RNA helicase 38 [Raphanus sativus]
MADTVEKVSTSEASSSSTEAQITGEKTEPTMTTEKTKWGDVEEEEEEKRKAAAVSELNSLTIKRNLCLTNPKPKKLKHKSVTSGETPYTSASRFEDLNLSPELMKGLYVEMKFEKPSA